MRQIKLFLKDGYISLKEQKQLTEPSHIFFAKLTRKYKGYSFRDYKKAFNTVNPTGWNPAQDYYVDPLTGIFPFESGPQSVSAGTCALGAVAPGNLYSINNKNNTSTWRFYDMFGIPFLVTVNNFVSYTTNASPGMLGIAEKAQAKAMGYLGLVDKTKTEWQEVTDGQILADTLRMVTGRKIKNEYIPEVKLTELNSVFGNAIDKALFLPNASQGAKLEPLHAYRIMGATDSSITLYNPWLKQRTGPGAYITLNQTELNAEGGVVICYG